MAEKTAELNQLDQIALDIYSQKVAGLMSTGGNGKMLAVDAYRQAHDFLAARNDVAAGALDVEPPTGPQLQDCHCPNQSPTHVHNLISDRYGDLAKVARITAWLDRNPPVKGGDEVDQQRKEQLAKLNRDFPDLSWDMPQVNAARVLFPHYVAK